MCVCNFILFLYLCKYFWYKAFSTNNAFYVNLAQHRYNIFPETVHPGRIRQCGFMHTYIAMLFFVTSFYCYCVYLSEKNCQKCFKSMYVFLSICISRSLLFSSNFSDCCTFTDLNQLEVKCDDRGPFFIYTGASFETRPKISTKQNRPPQLTF
jgi:dolichol kinase